MTVQGDRRVSLSTYKVAFAAGTCSLRGETPIKLSKSYTPLHVAATPVVLPSLRLVKLSCWHLVMQGRRAKLLYSQPHAAFAGTVLLYYCLSKIGHSV